MKPHRPIVLEAVAFGVFIALVATVLTGLFVPAITPQSTPAQRAQALWVGWASIAASAAVGTLAAFGYRRYQRRRQPADEEPRWEHCGYILRGLPEPRCPECGQPFADDGKG